jgi:chorismate lyase / 3-hydroxybenzoate synthase
MTAALAAAGQGVLRVQRLSLPAWRAAAAGALGGIAYGAAPDAAGGAGALPLPLLGGCVPVVDSFFAGTPRRGSSGLLRWADCGQWLHGHATLEAAEGELEAAAYRLYRDVFALLQERGAPHLLRLWNYLPRINEHSSGLERYRQFNIGRQQAFIDSGAAAFEGSPAACAIGTAGGALALHFIAGRTPPRALENPRQVPAWRYPQAYGPRAPTFSRAALVAMGGGEVGLWISGTASIVGHESVHTGDVRAQVRETVANLRTVLATAQAQTTAALSLAGLQCCVYVRHAGEQAAVREELDAAWGAGSPAAAAAVYVQADICRAELRVEVEGHLVAPGRLLG